MSNIWWGTCTVVGAAVITVAVLCVFAMTVSAILERPHKRATEVKHADDAVRYFESIADVELPDNVISFFAEKAKRGI